MKAFPAPSLLKRKTRVGIVHHVYNVILVATKYGGVSETKRVGGYHTQHAINTIHTREP